MEKVLGIIAEYNPFHNGHLHHLNESKKIANCKYSVCVMPKHEMLLESANMDLVKWITQD